MNFCAKISGSKWYCHDGNFDENGIGNLDDTALVMKDIAEGSSIGDMLPKRRRIGRHAMLPKLRKLVEDSPDSWDRLVAIATFLGERRRADAARVAVEERSGIVDLGRGQVAGHGRRRGGAAEALAAEDRPQAADEVRGCETRAV